MIKLFDYQEEAVKQLRRNSSYALFFRMGRGKTLPTLVYANEYIITNNGAKILIIAPLSVAKNTWSEEIKKWEFPLSYSLVLGKNKAKAIAAKADIYITNRESVEWLYTNGHTKWDIIIVDELSSFKDSKSKRYKYLTKFTAKRFIGLTGSPAANSLVDLWAQADLLKKRILGTKTSFLNNFFYPEQKNGHIVYKWAPKQGAKEGIFNLLKPVSMYKDAVDIPVSHSEILVELENIKEYRKLENNYILCSYDKDIVALNAAVLNSKLRQMASGNVKTEDGLVKVHNAKVKALEEFLEAQQGNNVLIWVDFISSKSDIMELLTRKNISYTQTDVFGWNNGKYSVFLSHPKSMGLGVNLQHGGHVMLWYELPYSLELYEQGLARMARTGQTENVEVFYLLANKTVDTLVLKKLKEKDLNQLSFLNQYKGELC
jgi:SNF2 family DNA or RNA helicase